MKMKLCLLFTLCFGLQLSYAQIGRLPLSPLQESKIMIGTTDISITYSRPSMRGRVIFGDLVPFNQWWRTGANRNTTIEFSEDVVVQGKRLKKGKYAVFSKPSKNTWELMFYTKTDHWNVPEKLDSSYIATVVKVPSKRVMDKQEVLSIVVGDFTNYQFNLEIAWAYTRVTIPIGLTTEEIMEKKISRALGGPIAHDYYAAARYELESGNNYTRGLKWIDLAIDRREQTSWWDLRIKSLLNMNLGEFKAAEILAKQALKLAKQENHTYGIQEMSRILKLLGTLK